MSSVEGWHFSRALRGRLRRDGAVVEMTVDKSSAWVAVKIEPGCRKLKNLHWWDPLPGNDYWRLTD
jgi:hypothetical protein